jgi:hypothetical protein
MLLADRGYDANWIRAVAAKEGAWANIPTQIARSRTSLFEAQVKRASETADLAAVSRRCI